MPGQDYTNLDRPYDSKSLSREADLVVSAAADTAAGATPDYLGGANPNTDTGGSVGLSPSSGGAVQQTAVPSAEALDDVWINTFIRSPNWQPKKSGFTIEGDTGYAEFANVYISGPIVAASGTIGGWTISSTELSSGSVHINSANQQILMGSASAPGTGTGIFMGLSAAQYQFRIGNPAGAYLLWSGTALTVNAPVINQPLLATALASGSILNVQGWKFSGTFSVTDADTVAWTTGTLSFADTQTFSISGGNTGNMSAKTIIYFDKDASTTVFQTTTTDATAVGANKVIMAVAQNGTGEATYTAFNSKDTNINAASIVANSITANELSTTITYAGAIIVDTAGLIRSGQTAYDTGTGWFIGNVTGTPKLSIGNSSGNKLTWDGSALTITGVISGGTLSIGSNASIDSSGNATFVGLTTLSIESFANFESSTRYGSTSGGTGSRTFDENGLTVKTGATAASYHYSTWWATQNVFAGRPTFSCVINASNPTIASGTGGAFFGLGEPSITGTGLFNGSDYFCGFYINKASGVLTLYAIQNDNTGAYTISAALTTITTNDTLDLVLKINGSDDLNPTSIDYYWRKNANALSAKTTLSTRLPPPGTSNKITFGTSNTNSAFTYEFIIISASYKR